MIDKESHLVCKVNEAAYLSLTKDFISQFIKEFNAMWAAIMLSKENNLINKQN